jgi:Ca2+:H+ antiporter
MGVVVIAMVGNAAEHATAVLMAMRNKIGLEFTLLEVAAVMLSVLAVANLAQDGRTNWFEGVQLLAIYAILSVVFFFMRASARAVPLRPTTARRGGLRTAWRRRP